MQPPDASRGAWSYDDARASRTPAEWLLSRTWHEVAVVVLFWTLFGALSTITLILRPNPPASAPTLVAFAFGGAYTWAALSLLFFRVTRAARLPRLRTGPAIGAWALFGIIVAVSISAAISGLSQIADDELRQLGFMTLFNYRAPTDLLAYYLVLVAGIARDHFDRLLERQRETAALRVQLVESRLAVLRTQLSPHFLFNSLNAVSALATVDPQRVRRMLSQLSELLRYMLADAADEEVSLEREVEVLRLYFEMLETRYEGWLQTVFEIGPGTREALVPNLILQPLAENAIKHGVGPAGGRGLIEVRAKREGDELVLSIRDSGSRGRVGAPDPRSGEHGTGFGLRHTRERLEQLYRHSYDFRLFPEAGGMVAEIRIPFRSAVQKDPVPKRDLAMTAP